MGELSRQEARLRMTVTPDEVDVISGELWRLGTLGVQEVDTGASITLLAGFASAVSANEAARQLEKFTVIAEFGSRDYLDTWRAFATIYHAGNRLVVKPPWVHYEPEASELVLWIDPGRSFGSGSHVSTRLALAQLEQLLEGNESVLDFGCGSGVLAVAAARLGATHVVGIDIDSDAPQITLDNAKANGVRDFVEASTAPLTTLTDEYNVVVANMLASTLIESAELLIDSLRPAGRLVVSGLLESQIDLVVNAFNPLRLLTKRNCDAEEGAWVCLTLG